MARAQAAAVDKEKKSGSFISVMVVILIIALWLAIFAVIIKLDIGGLGSTLRPSLRNIPIVNTILPDIPEELEAFENNYPITSLAEAVEYIEKLEADIDALLLGEDSTAERITELEAENARLRFFEDQATALEEEKMRFDTMVVFNDQAPELAEYMQFYQDMYPENAALIFELIAKMNVYDEGIQNQADLYRSMKPANAAAALEVSTADIGRVAKILNSMKLDEAAEIMDNMTPLFNAKVTQRMDDMARNDMDDLLAGMLEQLGLRPVGETAAAAE